MKKSPDPLYLTARQAAGELSVSPATLYAYVSRGMIRSEAVEASRERRYRAEDVRALKGRRNAAGTFRNGEVEQQPVIETAVSTIAEGGPVYRGVDAVGLAADATLEQAATLLWDVSGIDPFEPGNLPVISEPMRGAMAVSAAPLSRAMAALAFAAEADPQAFNRSAEGRARIGARIMRLGAAAILGTPASADPIHVQIAHAWASGHRHAEPLIRRALVLLADHELNPSTYTLRCAISTGLNLYDATVAGLAALKGPRHGGAGLLAARLVASLTEGDPKETISSRVALGEQIAGFGHKVYRSSDPRADDLLAALVRAGAERRLAVEAPLLISEATGLFPNIDYALAVLARTLAMPAGAEIALFAIARTAGWIAHGMEQLASEKLIRPGARYVGPWTGRARHGE